MNDLVVTRWRGRLDRCYALHQTGPGDLLFSHADAVYWWKLPVGDWLGLCAECCAEWRQFMPAPLRITDNRIAVYMDMLEQMVEHMGEMRAATDAAAGQLTRWSQVTTDSPLQLPR